MAPIATQQDALPTRLATKASNGHASTRPLQSNGLLDQYESFDLTPVIGREFPKANLVEMIESANADELLQELALTISQRGVVFFRAQHNLTNERQKDLIQRLGVLSGKPATSGLHIHPVLNAEGDVGEAREADQQISTISSKLFRKVYDVAGDATLSPRKQSSDAWHSDIAFEPVPADYTSLRLTQLPRAGGDTLWASGYEIYDRISPPLQATLERLTCTFARPDFNEAAARGNFAIYDQPRGSPENVGAILRAVHPVIRTNPVTGWKSVFPVGQHVSHINGVTKEESAMLLGWFKTLLKENHDLQVRFRWQSPHDIAIWDNRCTFHNATFDFEGLGERSGNRAVGVGEKPYFDPRSTSRREALAGQAIGTYFMNG